MNAAASENPSELHSINIMLLFTEAGGKEGEKKHQETRNGFSDGFQRLLAEIREEVSVPVYLLIDTKLTSPY